MTLPFDEPTRIQLWPPLFPQETSITEQTYSDALSQPEDISRRTRHLESRTTPPRESHEALNRVAHATSTPTLPLELLSEVFAYCCTEIRISCSDPEGGGVFQGRSVPHPEAAHRLYERTIKTLHAPAVALCQVCTTWNSVISASKFAWSRISLSMNVEFLSEGDGGVTEWARSKLAAVLLRSGESPLDVSASFRILNLPLFEDEYAASSYRNLAAMFFKENYRWKTAELDLNCRHVNARVTPFFLHPMPLLRTIVISFNAPSLNSWGMKIDICDSPLLQHVSLKPKALYNRQKLPLAPWSQLHSLTVTAQSKTVVSLGEAIDVLAACSSLELLQWDCPVTKDDNESYRSPVPMSQLQKLDVNGTFNPLIPRLSFPHLHIFHFHIEGSNCRDSYHFTQQLDVVRSMATSLTVDLSGSLAPTAADIWRMLGKFPEVKSLSLSHPLRDGRPPISFFDHIDGPGSFPNLQSLSYTLIDWRFGRGSTRGIFELVDSFRNTANGVQGRTFPILRTLTIWFQVPQRRARDLVPLSKDGLQILREFRAAGLNATVYASYASKQAY